MRSYRVFAAILLVSTSIILLASSAGAAAQSSEQPYRLVGYYASYSIYDDYFVTDIAANQLTHLIYGAVDISENGQCVSSDLWTDTQYPYPGDDDSLRLRGNIRQLQLMRGEHPNLKILMSVGSWEFSANFSDAALTVDSRSRLVRSCVAFMRQYLFDGIDLDWRYPVSGGPTPGRPEDRANYTLLMAEFRKQLDTAGEQDGRPYLLTMLAPATPDLYENIELDGISLYADWINLMTFGYQGAGSEIASHHAPLFGNTRDPRGEVLQQEYNVDATVNAYLNAGVPADKLVVGIPLYAQTWRNVKSNDYFGLYETANGVPAGTRPGGILYYRDMLPLLDNSDYTKFFDEAAGAPWLYSANERIAVSYENVQSIQNKVGYVQRRQLGGVMIWQLNYDNKADPLLASAYTALFTP